MSEEREPAEEKLHADRERLAVIVENMPAGFATADRDGRITFVNPAATRLWGRTVEEVIGRSIWDVFPEILGTDIEKHVTAAMVPDSPGATFETFNWPSMRWVEVQGFPTTEGYCAFFMDVTERHLAELDREIAAAKFQTLVSQIPAITYVRDLEGTGSTRFVSPQVKALIGYTQDELQSNATLWLDIVHPDDLEQAKAANDLSTATSEQLDIELRLIARDGRVVWVHNRATPVMSMDGHRLMRGVLVDITDRKRLEAELEERMKELACLFSVEQDVRLDLQPQEMCELTAAHLVSAVQFPDIAVAEVSLGDSSFSTGGGTHCCRLESTVLVGGRARGRVLIGYAEDREFLLPYEQNLIDGVADSLGLWLEHRETERTLQESESRFRLLAESARDLVYSYRLGPNPGFEYVSPSATAMTGYTPEEHYSDPELGLKIVHPDDRKTLESMFDSPDAAMEPLVVRWVRKDGTVLWTEIQVVPIRDEAGTVVALHGISRDVTERLRAEEELHAAYEALRQSNEQRRLLMKRLVTAYEDERKNIANDIHEDSIQVMTAVGVRLAILRHAWPNEENTEELDRMDETVQKAITRLRHLLFELRPSTLDRAGLATAIGQYADIVMEDEASPIVTLNDRLTREPSPSTRILLYRMAQDALANVRKHSRAKRVEITLEAKDDGMLLRVKDDGVGFDPETVLAGVSEHFGIVSMRERAEIAGGRCDVASAPGEGTTISFWVPDSPQPDSSQDEDER
ncbi:MAG: PAS domain S-box protein [Actinomycetota bacterium]